MSILNIFIVLKIEKLKKLVLKCKKQNLNLNSLLYIIIFFNFCIYFLILIMFVGYRMVFEKN